MRYFYFRPSNTTRTNKENNEFFGAEQENAFFKSEANSVDKSPFFHAPSIQTKSTLNTSNDRQEQEAEDAADAVIGADSIQRKPIFESNEEEPGQPKIQRKCAACEEEEKLHKQESETEEEPEVMTKPEGKGQSPSTGLSQQLKASKGGGAPLSEGTKAPMESAFGADFGGVKVHTDSSAVQMNKVLHAQAFTHGSSIYFNEGKYDENSRQGQHLLAHELTHVVQQGKSIRKKIQLKSEEGLCYDLGKTRPETVPYAASILTSRYPHLARVISAAQLQKIQNVIDAQYKIDEYVEKQKPYKKRIYFDGKGGYGGASSDVRKWKYYNQKIGEQQILIGKNKVFFIDSKLLAADDIKRPKIEDNTAILAFHEQLYKRFTEKPIRITIDPCQAVKPKIFDNFITYSWEAADQVFWNFSHDKGLIRFDHLMQKQKWNLDYSKVILGEQIKILNKMIELRREIGDTMIAEGKQLGVIPGVFSDDEIKVGREVGDNRGYYNDGRGRLRMYNDLTNKGLSKVSKVVLDNNNWLHIFITDPIVSSLELTELNNDGYLYVLTERYKSPDLKIYKHFITSDQRHLQPGTSWFQGGGWRMERELTEFEEFAIGAIFGDAFETASGSATFGQIVIGLIPIVGQIADVRDIAVGIHKMWTTGGKDGKLNTALAFVGLVPGLGDYIKNSARVSKTAGEAAIKTAKTNAVVDAVNELGEGVTNKAGKKLTDAAQKEGKEGVGKTLESLPGVKSDFVKAAIKHGEEAAGKLPEGVKAAGEGVEGATGAFGRGLPDLQNPKLVTQTSFKIGEELHLVKVVQLGNWKQLWLCSSKCGSLIARIDDALKEASGKTADRLIRLRKSAESLEKSVNAGKIKPKALDKKVGKLAYTLRETAKEGGLAKFLREELEKDYLKAYGKASVDELSSGAKEALKRGYKVTPEGYFWRLNASGQLEVVKKVGKEPKLIYDVATHSFIKDVGAKTAKKFDEALSAKDAFKELGGLNPDTPFGKFVKVVEEELEVTKKQLVDLMDSQHTAGFKGLLQDNVRHMLKKPFMDRLFTKITDVQELAKTPTFKQVMKETDDINAALRAASHEKLIDISKRLPGSDKGSLGEKWFKEWFTYRGEHVSKQVVLGAKHGMKYKPTRLVDIYEDHIAREVKNVTTNLGDEGAQQLSDLVAGIGKEVKVGDVITGYDSVRYVFLNPEGVKANVSWMITQLGKHPNTSLSFQLMNKYGKPLVISPASLKKLGEDKLKKQILDWVSQ